MSREMYFIALYKNSRSEVRTTILKHTNTKIKQAEIGFIGFNWFNSDYSS